jgi:hypothetical protein
MCTYGQSQWKRGLRYEPFLADLNTSVVGSNPTRGNDACVRLFCVCVLLCVGSGFATD